MGCRVRALPERGFFDALAQTGASKNPSLRLTRAISCARTVLLGWAVLCPDLAMAGPALPLGMDTTLSLSAQYRAGLGVDGGPSELTETTDPRTGLTQRARFGFMLSRSEGQAVALSVQDAWAWGDVSSQERYGRARGLEVHEAFAIVPVGADSYLKLGRQEIDYDDQRLLSSAPQSPSGQAFDVGLLHYQLWPVALEVFFGRAPTPRSYAAGSISTDVGRDVDFGGTHTRVELGDNLGVAFTFLARHDGTDGSIRQTLGSFVSGTLGALNYSGQVYYQGGYHDDEVVQAYLWAGRLSYEPRVTWCPTLGAGLDYLSGNGTVQGVFDTLYGENHEQYGRMDRFVHMAADTMGLGLIDVMIRGGWAPLRGLDVFVDVHRFVAAKASSHEAARGSASFGEEVDLRIEADLMAAVELSVLGGMFLPGRALSPRFSSTLGNPLAAQWRGLATLEVGF